MRRDCLAEVWVLVSPVGSQRWSGSWRSHGQCPPPRSQWRSLSAVSCSKGMGQAESLPSAASGQPPTHGRRPRRRVRGAVVQQCSGGYVKLAIIGNALRAVRCPPARTAGCSRPCDGQSPPCHHAAALQLARLARTSVPPRRPQGATSGNTKAKKS